MVSNVCEVRRHKGWIGAEINTIGGWDINSNALKETARLTKYSTIKLIKYSAVYSGVVDWSYCVVGISIVTLMLYVEQR